MSRCFAALSAIMIVLLGTAAWGLVSYMRAGDSAALFASQGDIDVKAPITVDLNADIAASPQKIWRLLSEIDQWPTWNKNIKSAHMLGQFRSGESFVWDVNGTTISSKLRLVDREKGLAWTGHALGLQAAHVWTIEQLSENKARIRVRESMAGFPASLFYSSPELKAADQEWLSALKATAEAVVPRRSTN